MESTRRAGRTAGVLLLLQVLLSPLVNFVLMGPALKAPGFLENAAAHAPELGLAATLGLVAAALTIGVAVVAWPVLRRHGEAMALWFLVLAGVGFALAAVESMSVMSMLSLSQAYSTADAADRESFEASRAIVGSARNWAHYIRIIVGGSTLFVLFAALYRFVLVPRVLAALGMLAALLQITAVGLPLFGKPVMFNLIMPMGVAMLALVVWLLWKGFADRAPAPAAG